MIKQGNAFKLQEGQHLHQDGQEVQFSPRDLRGAQDQDILEDGLFNKLHQSTADDDDEEGLPSLKNIPEFQELLSLQTFRKGDH